MTQPDPTEQDLPRDQILHMMNQLSAKFYFGRGGHSRTATIAKLLASVQCERRISYALANPKVKDDQKFDSIFREKSEYATVKILDCLKRRLDEEGYNVSISTEVKDEMGRYDVTIVSGAPCLVMRDDRQVVRIEIKAALGLPLEQVERYVWTSAPLIVVRVLINQVILLRPKELMSFRDFSMSNLIAKAKRIEEGKGYTVPGKCWGCPDRSCPFNEGKGTEPRPLITLSDAEWDLKALLNNIPSVAERTASLVLQELKASSTMKPPVVPSKPVPGPEPPCSADRIPELPQTKLTHPKPRQC